MQGRQDLASARRTRIVATIGPASAEDAVLEVLLVAGMDAARVNDRNPFVGPLPMFVPESPPV
jgi:hypothetical protein